MTKSHIVYLLSGSNEGNRQAILEQCCVELERTAGSITGKSALYETAAWGKEDLPPHLNQALQLRTAMAPLQLLETIHSIENKLGRVRQEKWGLRRIDIDIIYFDNCVLHTPDLIVPHPLLPERRFALVPVCEIAGDMLHPVLFKTNNQLLQECRDKLPVAVYTPQTEG